MNGDSMNKFILFSVFLMTCATADAATSADSQPSPPIIETMDPIQKRVHLTILSIKEEKTFDKRLQQLLDLSGFLVEQIKVRENRTAAIDYKVTLTPLIERKQKLVNREDCRDARMDIIFRVAGGSGFKGSFPTTGREVLALLAAICRDPSLAKSPM